MDVQENNADPSFESSENAISMDDEQVQKMHMVSDVASYSDDL